MRVVLITMILCCYLYLGSVLITYLTVFSTNEALQLASIERYTNTYMLGWVLFISGLAFSSKMQFKNIKRNLYTKVLALVLCILVNISPILDCTLFSSESIAHSQLFRSYFNQYESIVSKLDESDNVEVLHIESKGFEYSVYNYLTASRKMHNSFSVGTEPYYEDDSWTKIFTVSEYSDYLADGQIDYVYISYVNDKFNNDFGILF